MVVKATVGMHTGNFIFDTGSERLLLNADDFKADPNNNALTATGNTGSLTVREKMVDSIHIDQLSISNILAHIVDLDHIEIKKNTKFLGIIGYNVFQHFEVFIDFQNKLLVFSRLDRKGERLDSIAYYEVPVDSMNFILQKHLIVVPVTINGVKMEMFIDSGAELNLIDRKVQRKALDNFRIIKRVNIIGVGKRQVEVIAGTMQGVKCGNQDCRTMNTLLTSLDDINSSLGVDVEGVLGYEFLNTRRMMINYKKKKLYFFAQQRS